MPKSLAEGREKWSILSTIPANPEAVTLAEAEAGLDISCALASADSRISAAASATFSDPAICDEIAVQMFGQSNYEGQAAPFRYFTEMGQSEVDTDGAVRDEAWQALKEKATRGYMLLRRTSKRSREAFAAGDEYFLYEFETDTPQSPSDRSSHMKYIVPLSIQNAWTGEIATA